ncbi:MAG: decaprenylphospho-beta-D-erythro-pentofuranosid-2-ulose 2-reductase [Candidatus Nanopelagicales bacterium]
MINALGEPQSLGVLGGTSQIALAVTAKLCERRTRTVVLAGRDPAGLSAAEAAARGAGATDVRVVSLDALDPSSHQGTVDAMFADGDLDVVLLAFGVLGDQLAAEADPDLAVGVASVNYVASVSLGLRVAKALRRQGHGTLVVLSSVAGERARRSNFVYGSSKAGLDAFAQGLGDSLRGTGVRVIIVRPGYVRTRMTAGLPEAPMSVDAQDVAVAVEKALTSSAEIVWVPAGLRVVMSGLRHLPRPVFRRLKV